MVERKKTDGERRGNAINSFIPRNGRAYLYLTSVKRTCVKYAPNQFPSTRLSASLFSLICRQEPVVTFGSGLFFISTADSSLSLPHLRPLLASSFHPSKDFSPSPLRVRFPSLPFPFSFCSLSFSPSKIVAPSRQRSSLYSGASNTRQNKQRKGGTGERGSVIDALFHPHPSTDSYLRIWILWEEKPRGFYRRARREERFSFERFFLSRACTKGNTRHLFRVFFLLLFFLVFS